MLESNKAMAVRRWFRNRQGVLRIQFWTYPGLVLAAFLVRLGWEAGGAAWARLCLAALRWLP